MEINKDSFEEPWPKNEFERRLEESIVAEDDGKIAGFAVGGVSNGKGILKLIAVNPNYRGKGVGKILMETVFGYLKENGTKEIIAHSRLHNNAGCSFLKSFGFEIIETVKNYYLNGEDAYLMKREL